MSHSLYTISRNDDFVNDMNHILSNTSDMQQQLYVCVNSNNLDRLGQILLSYPNDLNLFEFDRKGHNVLHHACLNGNSKMIRLLLSHFNKQNENFDELKKYINIPCNTIAKFTPFEYCCKNTQLNCMNTLLKYKELDLDNAIKAVIKFEYNSLFQSILGKKMSSMSNSISDKLDKIAFMEKILMQIVSFRGRFDNRSSMLEVLLSKPYVENYDKSALNAAFVRACTCCRLEEMKVMKKQLGDGVALMGISADLSKSALYGAICSRNIESFALLCQLFKDDKSDWKSKKMAKNGQDIFDILFNVNFHTNARIYRQIGEYAINNGKISKEEFEKKEQDHIKSMLQSSDKK